MNEKDCANAIRFLAIDAIEKAQSGHPGAPMGMAVMAEVLWNSFLVHNPTNPDWSNRDRFVLSNGHASMLLYALLHLTGYDVSIKDIESFRQLGSKTPGHPEYREPLGVETTTGPLGQGFANAVGMALAEKILAAEFNKEDFPIVDHYTYVFLGDGCLMEGISHEAASLAGTLQLNKLIAFWDNNGISIDGKVDGWFTDDTPMRFRSYQWHVIEDVDGHDANALRKAIKQARKIQDKPVLICCKTTIGEGSPKKAGTAASHGSPLGAEEVAATRLALDWPHPPFVIPAEIKKVFDARKKGELAESKWQKLFDEYAKRYPDLAAEYLRRLSGALPENTLSLFPDIISSFEKNTKAQASRVSSKEILDVIAPQIPELLGGSADLSGSVGTKWKGAENIRPEALGGRYLTYGVREFGMGAIMNGLALHGGFIPYAGTFLVFSDYAKNAIRLAALMQQRVIWVLTHDSIMMGEDGPTHQPVEQLAMLRLSPNTFVWRPCDAIESSVAWSSALQRDKGPSCLCLSRQDLPTLIRDSKTIKNIGMGGYIIKESSKDLDIILLATGYEVHLALEAAQILEQKKIGVRVVSMPCCELFDQQCCTYKESVLPHKVRARVAIEAAASDYWRCYVGLDGAVLGMDSFGASGPAKALYKSFGFTVEHVVELCLNTLSTLSAD